MPADDCIFCNIISGDIPSYTLYEDDDTYVFLDVNPVSNGHLLVIPKQHAEEITDLNKQTTAALFETVHTMAEAVENKLNPQGINLLQNNGEAAGQEVGHVHVHVIPRYEEDGFDFSFNSSELEEEHASELVKKLRDQYEE